MTDTVIPTRASEILISKICHDLISPVGAVNNGIEYVADMGADGLADGLDLLAHSARQASVKLQLFRMCYGAGGSDAKVTGKTVYETFQNYIRDSKATLEWDLLNDMPDDDLPAGYLKIVLNAMVYVFEALPKGGVVKVTYDGTNMHVTGTGDRIKLKEGAQDALNGDLDIVALTPQSVHGYILKVYSDTFAVPLQSDVTDEHIVITI